VPNLMLILLDHSFQGYFQKIHSDHSKATYATRDNALMNTEIVQATSSVPVPRKCTCRVHMGAQNKRPADIYLLGL
jgi:hypothetical protein